LTTHSQREARMPAEGRLLVLIAAYTAGSAAMAVIR
jgi:hypothetical protein